METMRIMLDTSAYIAFLKGHQGAKQSIQGADEINLSPVVVGELLAGFMKGKREARNREILQEFMESPRVQCRAIDEETAERYAAIFSYLRDKGMPIPTNDLWIAASAMQFGLKLVTTDRHFQKVPQIITELHVEEVKEV
jgi:tRNA(fMet)-specific endonuclease VapC